MANTHRAPFRGIITGRIGVGKSTVCQGVIALARERGYTLGGVLTPALLGPEGDKVGIAIVDLATGQRRTLARICQDDAALQVGKYAFDPQALAWGCAALEQALSEGCDLFLVDEVGPLELLHGGGFVRAIEALAQGLVPRALLVVRESLLEVIQERVGSAPLQVFRVTEDNRDRLPDEIAAGLCLPGVIHLHSE